MITTAQAQQQFDQASCLLLQANKLALKLCAIEMQRQDQGQAFCWRLSDLIQRANARCNRRFIKTMASAQEAWSAMAFKAVTPEK